MRWDPDSARCRTEGGLLHLAARGWQASVPLAALRRVLVLHKHGALPTAEAERAFVFEADEAVHLVPETSGIEALLPALEQDPPRLYEAHYATSPLSRAQLRGPLRLRFPAAPLKGHAGHG